MTEREFETELMDLLEGNSDDLREKINRITTFAGAHLMTRNKGLVVRTLDGEEFHLTIVKG